MNSVDRHVQYVRRKIDRIVSRETNTRSILLLLDPTSDCEENVFRSSPRIIINYRKMFDVYSRDARADVTDIFLISQNSALISNGVVVWCTQSRSYAKDKRKQRMLFSLFLSLSSFLVIVLEKPNRIGMVATVGKNRYSCEYLRSIASLLILLYFLSPSNETAGGWVSVFFSFSHRNHLLEYLFFGKYWTSARKTVDCVTSNILIMTRWRFFSLLSSVRPAVKTEKYPSKKHTWTRFASLFRRKAKKSIGLELLLFQLGFFWSRLKAFSLFALIRRRWAEGKKMFGPWKEQSLHFSVFSHSFFLLLFCSLFFPRWGWRIMLTWFMRASWSVPANFSKIFT